MGTAYSQEPPNSTTSSLVSESVLDPMIENELNTMLSLQNAKLKKAGSSNLKLETNKNLSTGTIPSPPKGKTPQADPKKMMEEGILAYDSQKFEAASSIFSFLVAVTPENDPNKLLADCYWFLGLTEKKNGNKRAAMENLEKSLKLKEEEYAEYDSELIVCYQDFALLFAEMQEYEKAINYLKKSYCLMIGEEVNPDIAVVLNKIGMIYIAIQNFEVALEYFLNASTIQTKSKAQGISVTLLNQAYAYCKLKKYELASQKANEAIENRVYELGERDPGLANCYDIHGLINQEQGLFEIALAFYEKALKIKSDAYGFMNEHVAVSYLNLGEVMRLLKRNDEAKVYFGKTIKIRKEISGENSVKITKVKDLLNK